VRADESPCSLCSLEGAQLGYKEPKVNPQNPIAGAGGMPNVAKGECGTDETDKGQTVVQVLLLHVVVALGVGLTWFDSCNCNCHARDQKQCGVTQTMSTWAPPFS